MRGVRGLSDRGHTAASQLAADAVDWDHLFGTLGVRWFHTGGIYAGPLVIEEIDIPDPGPNQVTVRSFASGVCYSQVHQLRSPGLPKPMGLGHEGSGVVTQVGRKSPT